jgi:Arc/MetJ family transcription regulator
MPTLQFKPSHWLYFLSGRKNQEKCHTKRKRKNGRGKATGLTEKFLSLAKRVENGYKIFTNAFIRLINFYTYLHKKVRMTVKLNLTIDEKLVAKTKRYASRKKTSVSKLVQDLLKKAVEEPDTKRSKSFLQKHGGILNGKLGSEQVKQLLDESVMKKYGH